MGKLIGMLLDGLRRLFGSRLGTWIAGAMAWLGLSFGTQQIAMEPTLDLLRSYMQNGASGQLGAAAIGYMGVMKFDVLVSMLISAVTIRHGITSAKLFLSRRAA